MLGLDVWRKIACAKTKIANIDIEPGDLLLFNLSWSATGRFGKIKNTGHKNYKMNQTNHINLDQKYIYEFFRRLVATSACRQQCHKRQMISR